MSWAASTALSGWRRSGGLDGGPELGHDGVGVVGAEDGRPGDEDVRARLSTAFDRLGRDPAVDLEPEVPAALVDQLPGPAYLRQAHVEEPLAAEPGFDRHDQDHVPRGKHVLVRLDRRRRLQGQAGTGPLRTEFAGEPYRGVGSLDVERDAARAGLDIIERPTVRLVDHQMDVER